MSDVRTWVDGTETVRVSGLDATAAAIGAAQFELELLVGDGVVAGGEALGDWRGRHAKRFVEDANDLLRRLSRLVERVTTAKRTAMQWPSRPGRRPLDEENARPARLAEPEGAVGTSSADPDRLDSFRFWCEGVCERLPGLMRVVNLDGVTADVTRPVSVLTGFRGDYGLFPRLGDDTTTTGTSTPVETETVPADPATYVDMPDVTARTTTIVERAGLLGAWTGVVAAAFRLGDLELLRFVTSHPDLADELLAGFSDQQLSGESALVILLAYFDRFDADGGGVSRHDLEAMSRSTGVPAHVAAAAGYLLHNERLFDLVETVGDGKDYALEILGGGGDEEITAGDVTEFLAFNDQLAVLEQNFGAFDTAAHPGQEPDGQISHNDLEAMAAGDGDLADAAAWLIAHGHALTRLNWYQAAKEGSFIATFGSQPITLASLALLTVDQQVYADRPNQAGAFVDRRLETLMNARVGGLADPDGMNAVFSSALTTSDGRAALMDRVIADVATDGTIHNPGLHQAFANGTAANMALIDHHINAPSHATPGPLVDDPEADRQDYLNTHDFLREVSRDPDAADRLRQAVFDHGLTEVASAPDSGEAREERMRDIGRVQGFLGVAQDNALTGQALEDLRAALEQAGPGPTLGSATDYAVSRVPYADTFNDIADGMGLSAGDGIDWLLGQLDADSPDAFDSLTEAERIDRINKAEDTVNRAVWLAVDLHGSDPVILQSTRGEVFVDANGAIKTSMTPEEAQAFRTWATTLIEDGGPARHDDGDIRAGAGADVTSPTHEITIEGRR